jgi:transposase
VVLIWDGLKAHRARLIEGFVPDTRAIYPVLLAPYAPELNSIEYAWGYLKHHALTHYACLDTDTLADTTRHDSHSLQRKQHLLRSFILHSPLSFRSNAPSRSWDTGTKLISGESAFCLYL